MAWVRGSGTGKTETGRGLCFSLLLSLLMPALLSCVASNCIVLERRSTVELRTEPGPARLVVYVEDPDGQPADAIPDLVSTSVKKAYCAPRFNEGNRSYEFSGLLPNHEYRLSLYTRCERLVPGNVRTLDHVRLDRRINLRPNETREILITLKCRAARVMR